MKTTTQDIVVLGILILLSLNYAYSGTKRNNADSTENLKTCATIVDFESPEQNQNSIKHLQIHSNKNQFQKDSVKTAIHEIWQDLLSKHVSETGYVDYKGFMKDLPLLEHYLKILKANKPAKTETKNVKLAYWINVYNAFTIKLILDNYPVKSIKDIKKPWSRRFINLGDNNYSLNDVEHKILRKMNEPRIHFAIVCASLSCPKLLNRAFLPEKINVQLENATQSFLNDPKKNSIKQDSLELSLIFKWFSKDFEAKGSLISFIKPYVSEELTNTMKVSYKKYNWDLNGS